VLLALLPVTMAQAAPATGTWVKTRTGNIESNFRDTFFLSNGTEGWAVGTPWLDAATMNIYHAWHTNDAGMTWTPQVAVPDASVALTEMLSVYFRNQNLGWTCGQMGVISRCTDGTTGVWEVTRKGTSAEVLQEVFATSDTDVWAVGVNVPNQADPSTWSPLVVKSEQGGQLGTWHSLDLKSIAYADANNGWAVGPGGTIIHTINGGTNWGFETSGTPKDLNAVYAVSPTEAWVAGASGTILHTTDQGATWSSDFSANAVFSLNPTHTWVAGSQGAILFYDGTAWTVQGNDVKFKINAIKFINANYGWAVGDGGLNLYTTNGGGAWNPGPVVAGNFNSVSVFDDSGGSGNYLIRICGAGGVYFQTSDVSPGGAPAAWTAAITPPPAVNLNGMDFSDASHGVIVGAAGTILYTVNGGSDWFAAPGARTTKFTAVAHGAAVPGGNPETWIAVGENGAFWQSRNAVSVNAMWNPVTVNDVAAIDATTRFYVGTSGMILKETAGPTWAVLNSTTAQTLRAVAVVNATTVLTVGENDTMLVTDDGGTTWNPLPATGLPTQWNDITALVDGGSGYARVVGNGGQVLTYKEGDPTWTTPASTPPGSPNLNTVQFLNKDVGWAMGQGGVVWQTMDASSATPHWTETHLNATCALASNNVYYVGDGGTIIHWDGSEATLEFNAAGWTSENLRAVSFANSGNGLAVGDNGYVTEFTAPGGVPTWSTPHQVGAPNPNLRSVVMTANDAGIAVGANGYVTEYSAPGGVPTWSAPHQVGGATNPNLNGLSLQWVTDHYEGYAAGDDGSGNGYTVKYNNGTWDASVAVVGAPKLNSLWLNSMSSGVAVGDNGYYVDLTAPDTWAAPARVGGANPNLFGISLPAGDSGFAVGGNGTTGYRVPRTSGTFGAPVSMGAGTKDLSGIGFPSGDANNGFAVGQSRTAWTYNGTAWSAQSAIAGTNDIYSFDLTPSTQSGWTSGASGKLYHFTGGLFVVDFAGSTDLYKISAPFVGFAMAVGKGGVYATYNGTSWSTAAFAGGNDLFGVAFTDASHGAVAGGGMTIWSTTNGTSWNHPSGIDVTTRSFTGVSLVDSDHGWTCGDAGTLYRYDHGVINPLTSGTTQNIKGVSMNGVSSGFAVGDARTILANASADTWTTLSRISGAATINGMTFPTAGNGWFAGAAGFVLKYDKGTFVRQDVTTTEDFNSISLAWDGTSQYVGAAVGTHGKVSFTGDSGTGWINATGVGTTVDLNGIEVLSPTKAILCGDYDTGNVGTVRRSGDGGHTWTTGTPMDMTGNHQDLKSISFGDATHDQAWVVGTHGVVFTTTDAGSTWTAQTSGVGADLNTVSALYDGGLSDYVVSAAGAARTIIRSVSAGALWTNQSYIPSPGALTSGSAYDANNVYFCGAAVGTGGLIERTSNGGATFMPDFIGAVPTFNAIHAYSGSAIWAVGDLGWAMFNGGGGWAPQVSHAGVTLRDVAVGYDGGALSAFIGVMVGDNGTIMISTNASAGDGNWVAGGPNFNKNDLYGCTMRVWDGGPYVSYTVGDAGTVLATSDGGINWNLRQGPSNKLNATSFYDSLHGWAVGARGCIFATADGGSTWTLQGGGTYNDLTGVYAADATHVWAVGTAGTVIFFNGTDWASQDAGAPYNDFLAISGTDATHVWAVGALSAPPDPLATIRFFDGSWHNQDADAGTVALRGVSAADATHVWAVGDQGEVLFGNGTTWSVQRAADAMTPDLHAVSAPTTTEIWATGVGGTAIRSTNAGTDWTVLNTDTGVGPTTADLNGVKFVNDQNGWAVGTFQVGLEEAKVIYTTDGGNSWTNGVSATGVAHNLYGVTAAFNGVNWDFFAVGDWGLVQKTGNSTAAPVITPPLSPTSGTVSPPTLVTIDGSGFGADQATVNGRVLFNGGVEGTVAPGDWSPIQVKATVPSGAYGWQANVRISTDGGTSNGAPFTVTPSIATVTASATGGDTVTIAGEGFGPDPGAGHRAEGEHHVTIGGSLIQDADVTSWSTTQIQVTLPNDIPPSATAGVQVTAENAGNMSNTFNMTVVPTVTSLDPTSAQPGDVVTIHGTNFGTVAAGSRSTDVDHVSINTSTGYQRIVDDGSPTSPFTGWSPTSIDVEIPYTFGSFEPRTGNVTVTAASQASNNTNLPILSKIDSRSPANAMVGDPVTINGECFGDPQGASTVTFNGTGAGTATTWHDNQIVVDVPAAATSGNIKVTTADGDSNTVGFLVNPHAASLSAPSGRVGDALTITGSGFGATQGASTVSIGGAAATVTHWGISSITATVPNGAVTGNVVVTTAGGPSENLPFTVMPKITTINPTTGTPGVTSVTITGFTFGATQGASTVKFHGVTATAVSSWSSTQIIATAPTGCTTGNVVVTTADGDSNGVAFSVGPYINSVTPDHGPPMGEVTIAGVNFKNAQAAGTVKFNGVDAGTVTSWTNSSIKVKVPYGAKTGNVVVTTSEGASNGFPFTIGLSNTYYFAEGTTRPNFEEWLCLMNPNAQAVNVTMTYMLGDGTTKVQTVSIPKTSRMTLFVPDAVGANKDVSTKVESEQPIVAERPMYFNYGGVWTGGHDVIGAISPAQDWYFAEGNTRDGFEEWICLQNPNALPANATITYMLPGGQNQVQQVVIPATSRKTISVKEFLGPNKDCSAKVHADRGVIAERPMYFVYKPGTNNWTGGHDVIGANAPGNEWYFAEGTTRTGFDEWLCLQNPGAEQAQANIEYMLSTGEVRTQIVNVPALSRVTVDVVSFLGRGQDVSMHVVSDKAIVAERPMYFDYVGLTGGSDVIGSTCSTGNWYFAEGATQNGFQEWMSIQNPGDAAATVTITYMLGTGQNIDKQVVVGPHSRSTVDVNSAVGWGQNVSARMTSSQPVIVERPMYFNDHGWTGGHDVVGFHY